MPVMGCPSSGTPSPVSAATAPGISPSPQALSMTPSRGSTTPTSRPARAAYRAVASPTGPPPATSRSRIDEPAGEGAERGVLRPDPHGQQDGVEQREHHRGDPRVVHHRQRRALDDDGDVV